MANKAAEKEPAQRGAALSSRDKLLRAAEYLILHEGPQTATLRRVADRAQVNMSLVSYHFGGLKELTNEVMQINSDKFLSYEQKLLDGLLAETSEPSLADLLMIFLLPLKLPSVFHPDKTAAMAVYEVFCMSERTEREKAAAGLKDNTSPLITLLSPILPHLDVRTITLRLNAISTGMTCLTHRTPAWEIYHLTTGERPEKDLGNFDDLLNCSVAMMLAPRAKNELTLRRQTIEGFAGI